MHFGAIIGQMLFFASQTQDDAARVAMRNSLEEYNDIFGLTAKMNELYENSYRIFFVALRALHVGRCFFLQFIQFNVNFTLQ